jgi:hypothetical protein
MGYIKGRFCSLRGLRQQIDNARDHERALIWVKTCIVIHTLISVIEEGDEDGEFIAELVQEGMGDPDTHNSLDHRDGGSSDAQQQVGGRAKRSELKHILLEHLSHGNL